MLHASHGLLAMGSNSFPWEGGPPYGRRHRRALRDRRGLSDRRDRRARRARRARSTTAAPSASYGAQVPVVGVA